jgi:hypothetical protein
MSKEQNLENKNKALHIGSVVARYFTTYKIKRDHSNSTELFFVNVPEAKQYGFGFQLNYKGTMYGFSVHT